MKIKNVSKHETHWLIIFDDGGGVLRQHSLSTGSESSLTLDELIIDALCTQLMQS